MDLMQFIDPTTKDVPRVLFLIDLASSLEARSRRHIARFVHNDDAQHAAPSGILLGRNFAQQIAKKTLVMRLTLMLLICLARSRIPVSFHVTLARSIIASRASFLEPHSNRDLR